jgi:phosphoribosyl 1,2-cyclic phosphodiesterase
MVRFTVLASGSKGNSTVLTGGRTRLLIDCGLSCRELFRRMELSEEDPRTLDAILVTHEHKDHVGGISVTARKLGIPVYFTEGTHHAWESWISPHKQMTRAQWLEQRQSQATESLAANPPGEKLPGDEEASLEAAAKKPSATGTAQSPAKDPARLPAVEYFQAGQPFTIGDIAISPFTTSHDAADPVGFVFGAEGLRLGYATDLGYISPNVRLQLQNLNLLMLESNHDLEMLRDGPYPWAIKQRVLSRVGHLSNDAAAAFLEEDYDGRAAYVILAHLSENNNLPDLARLAAEQALQRHAGNAIHRLLLAEQNTPLSSIYF